MCGDPPITPFADPFEENRVTSLRSLVYRFTAVHLEGVADRERGAYQTTRYRRYTEAYVSGMRLVPSLIHGSLAAHEDL